MLSFLLIDKHYITSIIWCRCYCISRLNIHYYHNRRYKSYITSLKAVIVSKSLISAGLDIDRILDFVFYDKILQIYRQHWVRKFYRHILSKYRQTSKKRGRCYPPPLHTHTHTRLTRPCPRPLIFKLQQVIKFIGICVAHQRLSSRRIF